MIKPGQPNQIRKKGITQKIIPIQLMGKEGKLDKTPSVGSNQLPTASILCKNAYEILEEPDVKRFQSKIGQA